MEIIEFSLGFVLGSLTVIIFVILYMKKEFNKANKISFE